MDMHNLGKKEKVTAVKSEVAEVDYPSLRISQDRLPTLKGLTVGDEVTIIARGEVKGVEAYNDRVNYTIELREAGVKGKSRDKKRDFLKQIADEAEKSKEDSSR